MPKPQLPPLTSFRGKAANGHRLYEIDQARPLFVRKAGQILQDRFGFGPIVQPIVGLDIVITECTKSDVTLHLGWDNWSGFYVMADSPDGDRIVDEFGDYVDSILGDPEIQAYRHTPDKEEQS